MLQKSIGLLLLLVAACSHPTQAPPVSGAPVAPAQTASGVAAAESAPDTAGWPAIVAFGDSLTAGYGAEPGKSFPDFLQRDLAADGYHYRVVNLGISGNTTKDGLARLKDVPIQKPQLIIVSLGGNDGLRGVPVTEMRDNLDLILKQLSQLHVPIVIGGITLPPNYGVAYVQQFNAVYPELARKYNAMLLPFMLQNVWSNPELMQEDGIHPRAAGNRIVAQNFLPLVESRLKKR